MLEFYVIASPIGNLQDITLRALETIKQCDVIICEDTRITAKLLEKFDIQNKKLLVYNNNSNDLMRKKILELLQNSKKVALLSDAGTPLISDPGYKLIKFLRNYNVKIIPLPGASAVTTALCASGIACDNFLFLGFLPTSKITRQNYLKTLPKEFTLVFFESPNRIVENLHDLLEVFGNRQVAIARELTKIHEEILNFTVSEMIEYFEKNPDKIRGEFVIILQKQDRKEKSISEDDLKKEIKKALKSKMSIKEISQNLAQIHGMHKKEVYEIALKVK